MSTLIRRCYICRGISKKDERYGLMGLIVDILSTYYWCEGYYDPRTKPGTFCIIGQRGLSEYTAKRCFDTLELLERVREKHEETIGWQYGAVMSLRQSLEKRREYESTFSEYLDQMSVSIYRVRRNIKSNYKIGQSDARATFDIDGFERGKQTPWELEKFMPPDKVLFHYVNNGVDRPSHFNDKIIVQEVEDEPAS